MSENKEKVTAPAAEAAPQAEAAPAAAPATDKQRKKGGRYVPSGIAFVQATFNNTKVTFTDLHGNVLCWSTGGKNGFNKKIFDIVDATRFPQEHGLCRAGCRGGRCEKSGGSRHEGSRSPDQWTRSRKRIRCSGNCLDRNGSQCHKGHHARSA